LRILRGVQELGKPLAASVVSVGNFDGLHIGHQEILRRGRELARSTGGELVAVTFEPHPLRLVAPERAPASLTPLSEKLRCLDAAGVDTALVLTSNRQLLGMTPRAFIEELVIPWLHPTHMVEGRSFGFGRGRAGSVETLARMADELGFEVVVVPPVQFTEDPQPERVSSSLVRRLIAEGRIGPANRCLGRRYALFGIVRTGKGRGHKLGWPTANLDIGDQLTPGQGVYGGYAFLNNESGGSLPAAVSIGHTPTFEDTGLIIEAHLLDFQGQLEGTPMRLEFLGRLRDQKRYDNIDELVAQIGRDVDLVRARTAESDPALGAPVKAAPA
jgi:riboflavin kinase/FMN adenylyltransferase